MSLHGGLPGSAKQERGASWGRDVRRERGSVHLFDSHEADVGRISSGCLCQCVCVWFSLLLFTWPPPAILLRTFNFTKYNQLSVPFGNKASFLLVNLSFRFQMRHFEVLANWRGVHSLLLYFNHRLG